MFFRRFAHQSFDVAVAMSFAIKARGGWRRKKKHDMDVEINNRFVLKCYLNTFA